METERSLLDHYESHLDYYSPLKRLPLVKLLEMVDVAPAWPLLDVGCGVGYAADQAPEGAVIHGIDYSPKRIARARERHPGHTWEVADLYEFLAVQSNVWPVLLAVEVLEHLENPMRALALMRSAADGPVVATVPVNLPYMAHLSVWPTVAAIVEAFDPDAWTPYTSEHVVLRWG